MRVIVSTTLEDIFSNFVVVDSLKKVESLNGVNLVIIHDFKETNFDVGVFISRLYNKGINKFIYINPNPDITVKMAIVGVSGHIYEDDFYLEDEEELLALLEELDAGEGESTDLALTSAHIVRDFIEGFARGEERVKAPLYLEQVNSALAELQEITQVQSTQLVNMGVSALEVFGKANTIITGIAAQKQLLEKQLKELEDKSPMQSTTRTSFGGNILFFPSYKYTGTGKVLLIRELSPCRYLTSLILAYENYLHYELNKRVKLIFVHQKGAGVGSKYSEYTSITQESMSLDSLYSAEIIATNNPKNDVMKKIFSAQADIYIVVDRLYGSQDIVVGRVNKLNAVGGRSDLDRFKVQAKNCIFTTVKQSDAFLTIPTINNYPEGVDIRQAAYMQISKEVGLFSKFDEFLQLVTK